MKILVLAEFAEKGGTMSFLKKLIRLNYELGNNTNLLMESYHKNSKIKSLCDCYNCDYNLFPTRTKFYYNPYISILYDIYIYIVYIKKHCYDLLFISNSSPWMFLILTVINKKTIYFVHSYPNQHLKFYNSLVKTIPRLLRKSSRIITVSQYSKSQLIKYIGFNPRRINVIYNSSNNSSLQNSNQKLSQDIILTLGRLTKIKNPHTWLEVADKVSKLKPNVKFIWVGADKMQKFEMYSLINKKKLNQFVEIIEYVDNPNKYLINASIYFQPSFSESHGISVIDAMSFSLPCVVSKVGGMQESVVQNVTGFLLDPLDVPGFVKRILQLIDDRELAINFGYNGKLMVKRIFSEKIQKKKLTDLYKDVFN